MRYQNIKMVVLGVLLFLILVIWLSLISLSWFQVDQAARSEKREPSGALRNSQALKDLRSTGVGEKLQLGEAKRESCGNFISLRGTRTDGEPLSRSAGTGHNRFTCHDPNMETRTQGTPPKKNPNLIQHRTIQILPSPPTTRRRLVQKRMGCTISKGVEVVAATDIHRPQATSITLFDINSIDEPWLRKNREKDADGHEEQEEEEEEEKPMHIPLPLLEKLENYELTPGYSWSEVSKALEDLKPSLCQQNPKVPPPALPTAAAAVKKQQQQSLASPLPLPARPPPPEISGLRPVRENSFVIRDREEREKNSDNPKHSWRRRDPLEGYPERPPPGARPGSVVLYTTTLGGVRRTYEDCDRARKVVEAVAEDAGVEVDERDVSLHGEFLKEVRELAGEGAGVPRLFVMGRYVGGAEEVAELNETGKLREMMRWVASRRGRREGSRRDCEGCGNARFVPCLDCSGSCKVLGEDGKEVVRCSKCNENGLVLCPLCH